MDGKSYYNQLLTQYGRCSILYYSSIQIYHLETAPTLPTNSAAHEIPGFGCVLLILPPTFTISIDSENTPSHAAGMHFSSFHILITPNKLVLFIAFSFHLNFIHNTLTISCSRKSATAKLIEITFCKL